MLINLKYLPASKKPKLKWRTGEWKVEGNEMITEARFLLHLFELCASFKSFCGTYFYSFFFHSCLAKKKWCINCAKVSAKIAFRYCKAAHSEVLPLLWYFIFHIHALHSRKRGSRWANLNCKLGRSLRLLWTPPHWLLPLAVSWATTTPPYHCTNPIRPLCPGHFFGILSCHIFCNFQVTRHENNAKVILSQGTAMPFAFRFSIAQEVSTQIMPLVARSAAGAGAGLLCRMCWWKKVMAISMELQLQLQLHLQSFCHPLVMCGLLRTSANLRC